MLFQEDTIKVGTVGVTQGVKIDSPHLPIDHESRMDILP
jgi:hypothetical protein